MPIFLAFYNWPTPMYENFFGFRDKPFKLVPDPEYLYLSPSHTKALSDLSNALEHGDGFVLVVGEVGTGKTTLCRYFLNSLDDSVAFAYIFNTQLEGTQLLAAICHEFGIFAQGSAEYTSDGFKQPSPASGVKADSQSLIQALNEYLIDQHQSGRKVLLLIDEAQNLTTETLEMIRLLSNLETTRHKLLQIILVGQPELAEKLSSYPMRQLSQRISVNCRLSWLNYRQTQAFIEHRLQIALNHTRRIFTPRAYNIIYRFSEGIPRQINIAAHRCLVHSYEQKKPMVDGTDARTVIRELVKANHIYNRPSRLKIGLAIGAALSVIIVTAFVALLGDGPPAFFKPTTQSDRTLSVAHHSSPLSESNGQEVYKISAPSPSEEVVPQPLKEASEPPLSVSPTVELSLVEKISALDPNHSRDKALIHLLNLWKQPSPNFDQFSDTMNSDRYFLVAALQYGLRLLVINENWDLVRKLNLPVIVSIAPISGSGTLFGVLTQWQDNQVRLVLNDFDTGLVDIRQVKDLVGEKIYLFWQNALSDNVVLSQESQGESVLQVKQMLNTIGYHHLPQSPLVDPPTYHAIVDFQLSQDIEPDGLIGPVTKILLFQVAQVIETPRLNLSDPDKTGGAGT